MDFHSNAVVNPDIYDQASGFHPCLQIRISWGNLKKQDMSKPDFSPAGSESLGGAHTLVFFKNQLFG